MKNNPKGKFDFEWYANKVQRKQINKTNQMLKTYNTFIAQYRPDELISPSLSRYSYLSLVKKIHKHLVDLVTNKRSRFDNNPSDYTVKIDSNSHFAHVTSLNSGRNQLDIAAISAQISKIIPDHLIHDIFLLHYLPDDIITLHSARNPKKYEIIRQIYNSLIKIITEKQTINSYYITEIICEYIFSLYANEDGKTCKALNEVLSGTDFDSLSQEEQKKVDDFINKLGKAKVTKIQGRDSEHQSHTLEQMMNMAAEKAETTNKAYTELGIKSPSLSDYDMSHFNFENFEVVKKLTSGMILSRDSISQMFNTILNKFKNEFSTTYDLKLTELVEDFDEFVDIMDLEYFSNSTLKNLFLDEIMVTTKKPRGKVDLYIDASGSMGSSNEPNSRLVLAKGVAVKFLKYKLVRNVYFFSDTVSKAYNNHNLYEILTYDNGGGTSFNKVLKQIKEENKHSIIITDGEDYANQFDSKAHWIGVGEADFTTFDRNAESKKFLENRRCYYYTGNKLISHVQKNKSVNNNKAIDQQW